MNERDFGNIIRSILSNVNNYVGEQVEAYGIKQGQFEYFLLINKTPGINQLELAKLKNVGKASVTKALKILEDDGFIRRVTDEKDRRNTRCYVTKKGEAIAESLIRIKTTAEKNLFQGFDDHEKKTFYEYLSRFHDNTQKLLSKHSQEIEIKE